MSGVDLEQNFIVENLEKNSIDFYASVKFIFTGQTTKILNTKKITGTQMMGTGKK